MKLKKSGIHERKYMSNIYDYRFGKSYDQSSLKEGLRGNLVNRDKDSKQLQKFGKDREKKLKSINK